MRTPDKKSDLSGIKGDITQSERDKRLGVVPTSTQKMHEGIAASEVKGTTSSTVIKIMAALAAAGVILGAMNEGAKKVGELPSAQNAAHKILPSHVKGE